MINRAIYTYWTNDGKNYLCGFSSFNLFVKTFKKSLLQTKKYFSTVVVYTDALGDAFLKENGFKVDTIIVDYTAYDFNTGYWNFSKLITYNLQNEPFVHIDTDLILKSEPQNLDANYLCEKHRVMSPQASVERLFLGDVICKNYSPNIICSGLLGGDPAIFKLLFSVASEIVKVKGKVSFEMMFCVEEVVLTALCKINNIVFSAIDCKFVHHQGSLAKLELEKKKEFKIKDLTL
jgi:hypothetical protein